ncbi:MAG: hypothetical protein ACOYXY_14895, partial [Thermodesulfobacteriota bacterium]
TQMHPVTPDPGSLSGAGFDPGSSPALNAGLKRLDSRFRGNDGRKNWACPGPRSEVRSNEGLWL